MSVFYFFDPDTGVNISSVREIDIARKNAVSITFDNGDEQIYEVGKDASKEIECFGRTIVQVIPCAAPFYNVYRNTEGVGYIHERINYFALCVDGEIRSLSDAQTFFELADEMCNFVGIISEPMLGKYPKSKVKHS